MQLKHRLELPLGLKRRFYNIGSKRRKSDFHLSLLLGGGTYSEYCIMHLLNEGLLLSSMKILGMGES